jgi:hypothetical protein
MFEQIAEGFAGFFLFISHWLSPEALQEDIRIAAIKKLDEGYRIECAISITWNEQMSDLIDAGIPLRFRIAAYTNTGDTTAFIRTLVCDIETYTYAFSDSSLSPRSDSVRISRSYNQMLIALRDYTRWSFDFGTHVKACLLEAELLPSRASQLNRTVDMSNICGCKKFARSIIIQEKGRRSRSSKRR